jgi:hypothetical protein
MTEIDFDLTEIGSATKMWTSSQGMPHNKCCRYRSKRTTALNPRSPASTVRPGVLVFRGVGAFSRRGPKQHISGDREAMARGKVG